MNIDVIRAVCIKSIPLDEENRDNLAKLLFEHFIEVDIFSDQDDVSSRTITISSKGIGEGLSVKPKNIFLNYKKLIRLTPSIALTLYGINGPAWIIALAMLHIWNVFQEEATITISQNHAIALYTISQNLNEHNLISEKESLLLANLQLEKYGFPQWSSNYFSTIIDELCQIKCIELIEGNIALREKVQLQIH